MSAPIISKIRVYNSNKKHQPIKNKAHVNYIGKRIGVMMNDEMAHGLFGKVGDMSYGDIKNIDKVSNYVLDKSDKGTHIYRGLISLKEDDTIRLGYQNRETWEEMLFENIFVIGEKIGIPPSRLEFVSAVHMDLGHPHLHYDLWDKEQDVKAPFIHPKISNDIRIHLTKSIYEDDLQVLYKQKNHARDVLTGNADDYFKDFFLPIKDMTDKEFISYKKLLAQSPDIANGHLMNNKFSDSYIDEIALEILELRDKLPKTGRLTYQFLEPELKEEIEVIVKRLINTNEDFRREFDKYVDASGSITSLYTTDEKRIKQSKEKAEDEIIKRLSNRLLSRIKEVNVEKWKADKHKQVMRENTISIILDLSQFLSRLTEANENKAYTEHRELSKQAKIEYAKSQEHASSIDWDK